MIRCLVVVLAVAATGCSAIQATKPIPQVAPEPITMRSAKTPTQVLNAADAVLRQQGWQISRPDSTPGVMTALRWQTPERWGAAVKCGLRPDSDAMRYGAGYYTITVRAQRAGSGSDVTIASRVRMNYDNIAAGFGSHAKESETDCVSTGQIEKAVAGAIGG